MVVGIDDVAIFLLALYFTVILPTEEYQQFQQAQAAKEAASVKPVTLMQTTVPVRNTSFSQTTTSIETINVLDVPGITQYALSDTVGVQAISQSASASLQNLQVEDGKMALKMYNPCCPIDSFEPDADYRKDIEHEMDEVVKMAQRQVLLEFLTTLRLDVLEEGNPG